eukprot:gene982-549_t
MRPWIHSHEGQQIDGYTRMKGKRLMATHTRRARWIHSHAWQEVDGYTHAKRTMDTLA